MTRPTALAAARGGGQLAPATDLGELMRAAVERGPEGVDMLERLLQMQERQSEKAAQQAFARAMVAVHREMPEVVREARNDHTRSFYARLEDIDRALRPVYTAHGFAVMFAESECEERDWFRLTCTVMHEGGHSVTTFGDFPHDTAGPGGKATKTALHGKGSTLTYGRRYLLCGAFNVTPVMPGGDRDGNPPPRRQQAPAPCSPQRPGTISDAQRKRMYAIAKSAGWTGKDDVKAVYVAAGYASSHDIPRGQAYDAICATLEGGPPEAGEASGLGPDTDSHAADDFFADVPEEDVPQ